MEQMSNEETNEMAAPSREMLEKIGLRANKLIAEFFKLVKSDEEYNKQCAENENKIEVWQVEASALMQTSAAIASSIIMSLHHQGVAINQLIEDHIASIKRYIDQTDKPGEKTDDQ